MSGAAGSKIIMSSVQILSHVMVQSAVASELIDRGHEVYMAIGSRIANPERLERLGIKMLYFDVPGHEVFGLTEDFEMTMAQSAFRQGFPEYAASLMGSRDCSLMMQDESFKRKAKELRFDLALIGPFVYAPCNLILAHYLEIPFVSMATLLLPWELRIPALPSFSRIQGWYPIVDVTTFMGRLINLVSFIYAETSLFVPGPHNTTLLQQYAPEVSSWKELIRKSELILTDIDHHMGVPFPAFPYFIAVPGLSARPAKRLDATFETLLNENNDGIIVMSFGTMVHHIPNAAIQKLLKAFSRLKQTVLARMEPPTDGTTVPQNVKLFSWIPQNDILGHANTRLFITHCGNSGQHEMLYHGIPFVGLPLFSDQKLNCHLAASRGYGIMVNIFDFKSEELFEAIDEVLNNGNYTKAIRKASEIFRDEPFTGRQKAAHWIEHVLKYGGSHLRSKSLDLPFYQFLMLDVLGVLAILLLAILLLVKHLTSLLLLKIFYRKPEIAGNGHLSLNNNSHKFKLR